MSIIKQESKKKLDCCCCDNNISVSPIRFEVIFTNGEKLIYCTYCLTEVIGEVPEDIKTITNIGEF